jgi:pyruvate,water dikinase
LPPVLRRTFALANAFRAIDPAGLTPMQLLEQMNRIGSHKTRFASYFMLANGAAGGWLNGLGEILEPQAPGRGKVLALALMAGEGGVTSAAHGYRLRDLADAARQDPAALRYLRQAPRDPQGWRRLSVSSSFRIAFERFLDEFGHRTVYEAEMANPRWREDPTYLLDEVCFLVEADPARLSHEAASATRAAAEAQLLRDSFLLRPVIRWMARQARQGAAMREDSKSALVALFETIRYRILEAGRRLTADGALERVEDVFHLAWIDLESYLRGEWDGRGARALVADRIAQQTVWKTESPPDVLIRDPEGRPMVMSTVATAATGKPPGDGLSGVGAAAGLASGPARILRHPSDGPRLQAGDVLVAPSTDPGWTPLFLRASALVMEVGGYLSHGAIVAREYGIPAVVNIPGILERLRDGQQITVDGDAGRVVLCEPEA